MTVSSAQDTASGTILLQSKGAIIELMEPALMMITVQCPTVKHKRNVITHLHDLIK